MIDRDIRAQLHDEIVNIGEWESDEEHPIYPIGARVKELKICPQDLPTDFCLPGHRYLFKHAWRRHPDQYWTEIIAYRIGKLMGLRVPPAFIARDENSNTPGALIEWYIGYDEEIRELYVQGGDFMQRLVEDFDPQKGTKHNFQTVKMLCRSFSQSEDLILETDWREYWGLCFLYDSIIGNTDRHQDNWGIIVNRSPDKPHLRFTPYFDNGTSLGYEILETNFSKFENINALEAYVRRGKHGSIRVSQRFLC